MERQTGTDGHLMASPHSQISTVSVSRVWRSVGLNLGVARNDTRILAPDTLHCFDTASNTCSGCTSSRYGLDLLTVAIYANSHFVFAQN